MRIDVVAVSSAALVEYARISIAYEVNAVLDIAREERGEGVHLLERSVATPYLKDYDAISDSPTKWPGRFDTSQWGLIVARIDGTCVGGATVAYATPGLDMLEGRSDIAVLWDIRVLPANRRQGIGAALFKAAEVWALARGCRQVKVETQNINVAACRFYARRGCVLRAVHHGVYPECPDEVQLLWSKDLAHEATMR
jgi:GNAT superfamily N-acetyltransferase